VLKAFQDVEDGLSELHHLGAEGAAEDRAVSQASQAERLTLNRYVKGAVDYLDVVTAQTTALRVRRQAIVLDTQRLQASVALIQAVGGGWQLPASSNPSSSINAG
jgi:outer membrane protein TolC